MTDGKSLVWMLMGTKQYEEDTKTNHGQVWMKCQKSHLAA